MAIRTIWTFADDISTDVIYPGRYMATVLPSETPQYAFADLPVLNRGLISGVARNGAIVAGRNFGCGSSREQAASAIQGHGLTVVARGFGRIFLQNAINLGLRTVVCPEIEAVPGDELEVGVDEVTNLSTGRRYRVEPLPRSRQAIIDAGGLIPYTTKRLIEHAGELKEPRLREF